MKISVNTWHFQIFDFWFKEKHRGVSVEDYQQRYGHLPYDVNLCPYCRIVLFWGPLRWLFTPPRVWYIIGGVVLGLLSDIFKHHGWHGLGIVGCIAAGGTIAVGAIIGTVWTIEKIRTTLRRHPVKVVTNFTGILSERVK